MFKLVLFYLQETILPARAVQNKSLKRCVSMDMINPSGFSLDLQGLRFVILVLKSKLFCWSQFLNGVMVVGPKRGEPNKWKAEYV